MFFLVEGAKMFLFVYFFKLYWLFFLSLLNLKTIRVQTHYNVTGHITEHGRKQELLNQHKVKREIKCMNE